MPTMPLPQVMVIWLGAGRVMRNDWQAAGLRAEEQQRIRRGLRVRRVDTCMQP